MSDLILPNNGGEDGGLIVPGQPVEIKSGRNVRLLICYSCGTVNRLRDFQGDPSNDWEMAEVIKRHLGEAANPDPDAHRSTIYVVDEKAIDAMDEATLKRAIEDRVDVQIREFRDDFKDSAMKCWMQHHRPTGGCPDWKDESKVIGRKVGIPPSQRAYQCDYCVVSVWMEKNRNERSGLFKGGKWR